MRNLSFPSWYIICLSNCCASITNNFLIKASPKVDIIWYQFKYTCIVIITNTTTNTSMYKLVNDLKRMILYINISLFLKDYKNEALLVKIKINFIFIYSSSKCYMLLLFHHFFKFILLSIRNMKIYIFHILLGIFFLYIIHPLDNISYNFLPLVAAFSYRILLLPL